MLKTFFTSLIFLLSFSAFACWKIEGTVAIDGESYKLHQKIDHGKEYLMPMGPFIFKMTVYQNKAKNHKIRYVLQEKKGTTLTLITKGEDEIKESAQKEIFAKGEEGQPHTIITIKLNHI